MNARIRELAEQAEIAQAADVRAGYIYPEGMEKFAELVVRECLGRIELSHRFDESTPSWVYEQMLEDIEEHFGIE
jgi:hypothetical protein